MGPLALIANNGVPTRLQLLRETVDTTFRKERELLKFLSKRDETQIPVTMPRPAAYPSGIHSRIVLFHDLRKSCSEFWISSKKQLRSPSNLLCKMTHVTRVHGNLYKI